MSEFAIRPMQESDYEKVAEMCNYTRSVSFKDVSPKELIEEKNKAYDRQAIEKRARAGEYLVAVDGGGKIIGVAGLVDNALQTLFVHPDWQGHGIGRTLYDRIESMARNSGITKLSVNSSIVAQNVYEHFGFVKIGEEKRERNGYTYKNILMEKCL